jgi:dehydrogenase/reductase SDR family protein 12
MQVCRNEERAESARQDIMKANGDGAGELAVLLGDVSRRSDVIRLIDELGAKEGHIDGLVCNAGALADKVTLTEDGVEETFACHLLFGSYLLTKLAKPLLEKATEPRVIFVSSGG